MSKTIREIIKMGKTKRAVRNGTGPHKDSYQRRSKRIGRRQAAGEKCPNK